MQQQFVITIDEKVSKDFAINFFKNVNFIKSIKQKKNSIDDLLIMEESTLMSEQSLAEDWLSDEDNRWDNLL